MPTHDTLAAARREAKTRSRKGGVTHQQALDAVAREAGHEHWTAMQNAHRPPDDAPILAAASRNEERRRRLGVDLQTAFFVQQRRTYRQPLSRSSREPLGHLLRELPFTAETVARIVSPSKVPSRRGEAYVVACPVHGDASASLVVSPSNEPNRRVAMACMAGCDAHDVEQAVVVALRSAIDLADAFLEANDASRVVEAWTRSREGGTGGVYRLEGGRVFDLPYAVTAMLPPGYPLWWHDGCDADVHAVEQALRAAVRGHLDVKVTTVADVPTVTLLVHPHSDKASGYSVHAGALPDGTFGIRANWGDDRPGVWDEIVPLGARVTGDESPKPAGPRGDGGGEASGLIARILQLAKDTRTTDPVEIAANERQREIAARYEESIRGTDADGWGWYVGPDEEEFIWGGPFKTKQIAIAEGNGHCFEEGEVYYVVRARVDPDEEPGEDGYMTFIASDAPIAVTSAD